MGVSIDILEDHVNVSVEAHSLGILGEVRNGWTVNALPGAIGDHP